MDRAQGDPFAPPSRLHVNVPPTTAQFPADAYATKVSAFGVFAPPPPGAENGVENGAHALHESNVRRPPPFLSALNRRALVRARPMCSFICLFAFFFPPKDARRGPRRLFVPRLCGERGGERRGPAHRGRRVGGRQRRRAAHRRARPARPRAVRTHGEAAAGQTPPPEVSRECASEIYLVCGVLLREKKAQVAPIQLLSITHTS